MKTLIKNLVHYVLRIKSNDHYSGDASACPVVGNGKAQNYGEYVTDDNGWTTLVYKDPNIKPEDSAPKCKAICDGTCSRHKTLVEGESTKESKKKEDK